MKEQGLFLKLNEVIDDPNMDMPVINSFTFEARKEGDGSGVTAFAYTTTDDVPVKIVGGQLFSDESATDSLGTSTIINGVGILWIKAINSIAKIVCRNADRIIGLGNALSNLSKPQTGNVNNSPYMIFNVSNFPVNLIYIEGNSGRNIYNGDFRKFTDRCTELVWLSLGSVYISDDKYSSDLYGDMTGSTALLRINTFATYGLRVKDPDKLIFSTASLGSVTNVINGGSIVGNISDLSNNIEALETNATDVKITDLYGDLKNLPINIKNLSFSGNVLNNNITYSGGRQWRDDLASLLLDAIPLSSFQLDMLLNDLATISWSAPKALSLRGTRTTASDAAIATLQSKGVTVTINA